LHVVNVETNTVGCNRCHKIGHFASQCRTKSVFACNEEYEEGSEHYETHEKFFIGSVNSENRRDEIYKVLEINNKKIKFKLDTGSYVNIISEKTYNKMKIRKLSRTNAQLYGYSGNTIPILGKCVLLYKDHQLEFFVTSADRPSILGYESCCELGIDQSDTRC
jgi:hypothetical protein